MPIKNIATRPGIVLIRTSNRSDNFINPKKVAVTAEAISFIINCENQEEVDFFWDKLTADGGEESQCGWLKDKYGVSWQITPTVLTELITDPAGIPETLELASS